MLTFIVIAKNKRGKKQPPQHSNIVLEIPKDKYIPLWEKSQPLELECDINFDGKFIEVKLYDKPFKVLQDNAREVVKVPYFAINPVVYAMANNPAIKIMDCFHVPFDTQPIGKWKGRAQVQLKWLVKTPNGFLVKSHILSIYLLYKY